MKWTKSGKYLALSNTNPAYKVARFIVGELVQYQASFRGEDLGALTTDPKEAQAICERHHLITQDAKEYTHGA